MSFRFIVYSLIMLLAVLISSLSQIILKKEAMKTHLTGVSEYLNLSVMIAYAIFFCSTMLAVLAYRVLPLSTGMILETTSYLFVTFFSAKFLGERIGLKKVFSLALITGGIVLFYTTRV